MFAVAFSSHTVLSSKVKAFLYSFMQMRTSGAAHQTLLEKSKVFFTIPNYPIISTDSFSQSSDSLTLIDESEIKDVLCTPKLDMKADVKYLSNALTCEPIPIYYDAASITASIADAFACDITAIHVDTPALTTVDDQEEEEVADADVDADADADDTATEADIEEVDTSLALCRVQSRMYPSHTTTTTDDDEEESAVTNGLPTFHSFSSLPPFVGDDEFDEGENDREEGEKYEHDEEEYENDEYYNDEEECESDEEEYGEDEEEIVWYFPMPPRKFGPLEIIVERDETEYEEK